MNMKGRLKLMVIWSIAAALLLVYAAFLGACFAAPIWAFLKVLGAI